MEWLAWLLLKEVHDHEALNDCRTQADVLAAMLGAFLRFYRAERAAPPSAKRQRV